MFPRCASAEERCAGIMLGIVSKAVVAADFGKSYSPFRQVPYSFF